MIYAGSALRGYGKLLIIKHSEEFLSAYAHNHKLLVGEGAKVKAGQRIADLGSSGTDRDMLHFEIRRNGQPVDPMGYLP
ncbi:septal ring factor EnvC (AmiA/AmiB activator) [Microbulbifer hydrolyticus]|uniref:Septal ring factor EnvC (AmiA/AmiB activator) n=1 Tax=Microbulbifer hydrolyticus TaxID=48074 RepID=A0AA89T4P5_9GAMM|nr:septal ring factor EnvC (AmiA/AmiB activator) [Microbulbifer hydrolyticus]